MTGLDLTSVVLRAGRVNIAASLGEKPEMYENALELCFSKGNKTITLVSFGTEMKHGDEIELLGSQRKQVLLVSDFPKELSERITTCYTTSPVSLEPDSSNAIGNRVRILYQLAQDVAAWRDN